MAALELEADQWATQPVFAYEAELQGEQEQRGSDKVKCQESKDHSRSYKDTHRKEK